jgi:hypothetical protein
MNTASRITFQFIEQPGHPVLLDLSQGDLVDAPWRLPGPDSDWLATTSFQPSQITSLRNPATPLELHGVFPSFVELRWRLASVP